MPSTPPEPIGAVAWVAAEDPTHACYERAGCTVLALSGEVDAPTALNLRRRLDEAIELSPQRVVVDLSRVGFLDVTAVGELVRALRRTGWEAGAICLVGPSAFVRRVLDVTHLGSVCPVYATWEQLESDLRSA